MNAVPAATCGLIFGLGLVGLLRWLPLRLPTGFRSNDASPRGASRRQIAMWSAAGLAGVLAFLVTGWPVAFLITVTGVVGLPALFRQTSGTISLVKIESIATWTEMLQGTLAASAGLGQALIATAPLSPVPLRGAANRLANRLSAGMLPRDALDQFADELGDPCSDRVVCALQLAFSSRAQKLGDLLAALADATRDEVALRLRIETSRASVRSAVRTVIVFSVAFAVGLAALAHPYLTPFGSGTGQVVLAVVGALYAIGMTLMVSLSRPPAPVRLIGAQVAER